MLYGEQKATLPALIHLFDTLLQDTRHLCFGASYAHSCYTVIANTYLQGFFFAVLLLSTILMASKNSRGSTEQDTRFSPGSQEDLGSNSTPNFCDSLQFS